MSKDIKHYYRFAFKYDQSTFFPYTNVIEILINIGDDKNKAMLNMRHEYIIVQKYCKMLLNGTLDTELERLKKEFAEGDSWIWTDDVIDQLRLKYDGKL